MSEMEQVLSVVDLYKAYSGIPVLTGLSLSMGRGEVFGLLGENGAGKSTAIECILGTRKADKGEVCVLGMSPQHDRKKLFEKVGVQFQAASYPDKIRVGELCEETACLYSHPADYRELLSRFHLEEKAGSPVSELSGGQRQSLFVLLALLPGPQMVFLDELTTGLDTRARREVWKNLLELKKKGLTIFLTSHYMEEVEALCDRIGILKDGQLIFNGTVGEAVEASPHDSLEDAYLWFTGQEVEA